MLPATTKTPIGAARPRLAPPLPARSGVKGFVAQAEDIGLELYPWQKTAGRYVTALGQGERWLYRHVCIVVARQNGKTKLLVPLIIERLRAGDRIMHTAQDRDLPRVIHEEVAGILEDEYPDEVAPNRHGGLAIRFASGQEEIRMRNGGRYRIVAPTRGGARGHPNDLVIIDELREMDTHDFVAAANPTLQASLHPQMLYLSNAGDDTSVVLNAIRQSRDVDPSLAYLEWSADADLRADSIEAWVQANPAIGHAEGRVENLTADYHTLKARGELAIFETENLCRWVTTLRERLVDDFAFNACRVGVLGQPNRPAIGVSMDPAGKRAAVAIAWRVKDGIAVRIMANVSADPVNVDEVGQLVKDLSTRYAASVGFDPLTDVGLAKFAGKRAEAIGGAKYANASAAFVNLVNGQHLRWTEESSAIADDLTWTASKPDGDQGHFHAVRAKDDHPIPVALATIRAAWLASEPVTTGRARVY